MEKEVIIGEFEVEPTIIKGMFLEDRVGTFKRFIVYTYKNEGKFNPHFHIKSMNDENFECCIRIDICEYFSHGTKDGVLNSKEKKELMKFLQKKNKITNGTNWERIINIWNQSKENKYRVDETLECHDYTKLEE